MKNKKIEYPATCTVHSPSGATDACDEHARQIEAVMGMLGGHTNRTYLEKESECSNCVNEGKKVEQS